MSIPIKRHDKKMKALVINEDSVDAADRNENGESKVAQKRRLKEARGELANANRALNGRRNRVLKAGWKRP